MGGVPEPDALRSLKRISDPTRARILRLLLDARDGRGSVTRLAEKLGLRQPTVSHHLKLLREEGLVERTQEGRTAWYTITADQLDRVAELVRHERPAEDGAATDRIIEDLALRYRGVLSRESVEQYVQDSYDRLDGRKNRASLTSAFAVSRLDALLRSTGERAGVPEVLFVCVQNAGRSQLASAILRQLAGDRVRVRTAGSEPADAVRSTIVTVLDEVGTPLGGEFPKPLTDEAVRAADYVITMGCGDACPIYPGREYLDWDVPDPVGQPLAAVRAIRDDIEERVRGLLTRIDAERLVNTPATD
ncbi:MULTISPECIES: metalloregulator ArsR/SmtB family transcription factor [Leifsonia]|uniref:Metalloregulator ArsR/SmtB family transcription factor n=1 Tax=Leifsonia virtsii TaxID=3035915 RepID=A0ABT8J098_9MICO|nr:MULTISPECIES: metalloregulator ArsR/SmtB family transcription factor [Leifsonia]MDN4597704.1 metalloregulator ArsR/SmtB family transcription factor [Leifsonia virtsii]NUU08208.1 metalloregulator ArsR/SmtB family transcription factor [Leifsonia sp. C5G2]